MKPIFITAIILLSLTACANRLADTYQRDKAPEVRSQYQGVAGANQYAKDQAGSDDKERQQKCMDATVGLSAAAADHNQALQNDFIKQQKLFCDK